MTDKRHYAYTFTQPWEDIDLEIEDNGMAIIYHLEDPDTPEVFVRLQSWDETKRHLVFNQHFKNRNLRVTIETID